MLDASSFRAVVSGRQRGVAAGVLRGGLRLAEAPYTWAMRARNWRYDTGRSPIERVDVPVVSIGNLTLGGTGKTPLVAWVARWFRRQGVRVTIVSRGYGAEAGSRNDEALELELQLPDVPHLQNPDRVQAARTAIEEFECQAIVLDDGFQHRRLHRDLDIVLLDALEPFGFEHVFPRGTLREPVSGLRRAGIVALSRADLIAPVERQKVFDQVLRVAPHSVLVEVAHRPTSLVSATGGQQPLEALAGAPVAAFCGIGNPAGFRHSLEQAGLRPAAFREFPDHHAYDREDIESLVDWAATMDVPAVVCTRKDLVKIGLERLGDRPLWALGIEIELMAGIEAFEDRLRRILANLDLA